MAVSEENHQHRDAIHSSIHSLRRPALGSDSARLCARVERVRGVMAELHKMLSLVLAHSEGAHNPGLEILEGKSSESK